MSIIKDSEAWKQLTPGAAGQANDCGRAIDQVGEDASCRRGRTCFGRTAQRVVAIGNNCARRDRGGKFKVRVALVRSLHCGRIRHGGVRDGNATCLRMLHKFRVLNEVLHTHVQ